MRQNNDFMDDRQYAWSYFQLHANQRMSSFNFFVVIEALLTTGLAGTFQNDFNYNFVGLFIGVSIFLIAFIFWKIDRRVRFLIKHAEGSLKEIEKEWSKVHATGSALKTSLFSLEETMTANVRFQHRWQPWKWHLSYSDCFGLVFLVFGVLGLLGVIANAIKLIG